MWTLVQMCNSQHILLIEILSICCETDLSCRPQHFIGVDTDSENGLVSKSIRPFVIIRWKCVKISETRWIGWVWTPLHSSIYWAFAMQSPGPLPFSKDADSKAGSSCISSLKTDRHLTPTAISWAMKLFVTRAHTFFSMWPLVSIVDIYDLIWWHLS